LFKRTQQLSISSFSPFEFPNRSMFVSLIIPAIVLFSVSAIFIPNKKLVCGGKACEGKILVIDRFHDILDSN
jgi:hypothetical protein